MKKISIKEIAKMAGVVPSTVSLVLNGKAREMRISEILAFKIKKLAEDAGYIPNQVAVSLRTGNTKILGLIVEDISNNFFATLAKIIEDEVQLLGYRIVYCSTENNKKKGNELINMLFHRQVDGYIITPSAGMEKSIISLLNNKKPVVLIDRYFPGISVSHVLVDNFKAVEEGIGYLISKGYRSIGFVTTDKQLIQMQLREQAYQDTLKKHNIVLQQHWVLTLPYFSLHNTATQSITDFLQQNRDMDAVFFATNYLGIHGLESLKILGWKIPEQIAVLCFDDHDIFKLYSPGITSIRQPVEELAKTAIHCLMEQIENSDKTLQPTMAELSAQLIFRESV